jgi:hypothetical protein
MRFPLTKVLVHFSPIDFAALGVKQKSPPRFNRKALNHSVLGAAIRRDQEAAYSPNR